MKEKTILTIIYHSGPDGDIGHATNTLTTENAVWKERLATPAGTQAMKMTMLTSALASVMLELDKDPAAVLEKFTTTTRKRYDQCLKQRNNN